MTVLAESIRILSLRLPELEWKLGMMHSAFYPNKLPRGLFRYQLEMTPQTCIDEIKADLQSLKENKNERSARYLAERVSEKINVLVRLCQMRVKKPTVPAVSFGVQAISTRQQWLQTLEDDIAKLHTQQQSLMSAFEKVKRGGDAQAILNIQAELGEIERRRTLAQDTLSRAVGGK